MTAPANVLTELLGRTNRAVKLPHTSPVTDRHHQANALYLEHSINQIPVTQINLGDGAPQTFGPVTCNTIPSPSLISVASLSALPSYGTNWTVTVNFQVTTSDADQLVAVGLVAPSSPLTGDSVQVTAGWMAYGSFNQVYPAGSTLYIAAGVSIGGTVSIAGSVTAELCPPILT